MSAVTGTTIHIFVNRRRLELPTVELTGEQLMKAAGFGPGYDLFLLHGDGRSKKGM